MSKTALVPISQIQFPPDNVSLRKPPAEGDKDYDSFIVFKNDIAKRGLLNLFTVRPDGDIYYVIDGFRRATAIMQLNADGIACPSIIDGSVNVQIDETMDEWDALASMISGNYNRKKTLTAEEVKAINRLSQQKNLTMKETAEMCGLSEGYLNNILKIKYLPEIAQEAVNQGTVSITNAIQLCKLPSEEVDEDWIKKAAVESGDVFTASVAEFVNEWKKAKQTTSGEKPSFEPKAKMMAKNDIIILLERAENEYEEDSSEYNKGRVDALKEIFHLDEKSIEAQKAEWEQKQAQKEENAQKRKEEREAKKLAEAEALLEAKGKKVVDA